MLLKHTQVSQVWTLLALRGWYGRQVSRFVEVINRQLLALLMGKALLTSPFLANTNNVLALPFHSYLCLGMTLDL